MDDIITVESRVTPPSLSCPSCNGLLPFEFGEIECVLCEAKVRIEHPPTRRAWKEEKVSCPECSKVLIAGVDKGQLISNVDHVVLILTYYLKLSKWRLLALIVEKTQDEEKTGRARNMLSSMRHRFRREVLISSSN